MEPAARRVLSLAGFSPPTLGSPIGMEPGIIRVDSAKDWQACVPTHPWTETRMRAQPQGLTTMSADPDNASAASAPKSRSIKARKGKPPLESKGKRSLNLSLPIEDYERLAIHAMRANTTISELVATLAREHLREYHLTRTATRAVDAA